MKRFALLLIVVLGTASLVSCAPSTTTSTSVNIVASTNVYGSIARAVAGEHAHVTSVIDNPAQDPHSFEAGPRVQLELSRADLVIANGGGYDDFIDILRAGLDHASGVEIHAVSVSGFTEEQIESNEHVWYDLETARALADAMATSLASIDPEHAEEYRENAERFTASVSALSDRLATLSREHSGMTALVTEPIPLYLLDAAGVANLTPPELSAAIESGQGVPAAVLNDALTLISQGEISVFVYNKQTAGPETNQLRDAAVRHGVPVMGVSETLPHGLDYVQWMAENIAHLEGALA